MRKFSAGQVRLEQENGHRFITDVVEAFPGEIQAISVSKPSLEDVFIHRTGHKFWTEDRSGRNGSRAMSDRQQELRSRRAARPPDSRRDAGATRSTRMMLVLSILPRTGASGGIARMVMNGPITTVDGLFMSIIMLALSGILFLNVYLEARKKFILKKAPQAQKTS